MSESQEKYFNVQIIDGAKNCTYSIFAMTAGEFKAIFPEDGQDIEFIEDVVERLGRRRAGPLLTRVWTRPVEKRCVQGIHGTLFYQLAGVKRRFYPTKKEKEMCANPDRS